MFAGFDTPVTVHVPQVGGRLTEFGQFISFVTALISLPFTVEPEMKTDLEGIQTVIGPYAHRGQEKESGGRHGA